MYHMLLRYLGWDTNTPTYTEALSGRNSARVRHSKGKQADSTVVLSLVCIKCNIDDVAS